MKKCKTKIGIVSVFIATIFVATQSAKAAQAVAATSVATVAAVSAKADQNVGLYHQLDALRSQNAILKEALTNTELRNKISSADKNPSGQAGQPGPISNGTPDFQNSGFQGTLSTSSAQVQMVSGMGNNLTAIISLSNGSRVNARVGSNISGVGLVKSISLNEVIVIDKKQTIVLPFARDFTSVSDTTGMRVQSMPQMPPLPQGMMSGGAR